VIVFFVSINTDPSVWNNPYEFQPERFQVENVPVLARFGLGARRCPGQHFGDAIVKIIAEEITRIATIHCESWAYNEETALISPEASVKLKLNNNSNCNNLESM
jgi:cytochrome P450